MHDRRNLDRRRSRIRWPVVRRAAIFLGFLAAGAHTAFALNPSLDISQYAHTAWNVRDGFALGNIYDIAQTPDGYLWLGGEFGLFRFDGVRSLPWDPPPGQSLPTKEVNRLLGARDGSLWIGTFMGLASWKTGKLTVRPDFPLMVDSLYEDRQGTVWAGSYGGPSGDPNGRVCALRDAGAQCWGQDGAFGMTVSSLVEDAGGNLWAATHAGIWRLEPGPPARLAGSPLQLSAITQTGVAQPVAAVYGAGLVQPSAGKLVPYWLPGQRKSRRPLSDSEVNANKLLRDRDGGLWIGTVEHGLIHVHNDRTDVFSRSDGLSGDVVLSLFEDREGDIWVSTTGGLDRFRELPITTFSTKQGLSSDAAHSVLAARDGSIWVGAHDGLTRFRNGEADVFRKSSGLPDDSLSALFEDSRGRFWASTPKGIAYFQNGRFLPVDEVRAGEAHSIAGDGDGNLWLSENRDLLHIRDRHVVEAIPWSGLGKAQNAGVILFDPGQRSLWLGFWTQGDVLRFQEHAVRASYTVADGLGKGGIQDLRLDADGAIWAATRTGGLSRIKDGHIATLTTANGLPCDAVHWMAEDDARSVWLYTGCGLVSIERNEFDAWLADPKHRVKTAVLDGSDGVKIRAIAASAFGPRVTRAADGKIWFSTGEGVQVLDPRHLTVNKVPPPVHIEGLRADGKPYPLHPGLRLPPNVRDVEIEFTGLSLAAPEKVRFKYMLEGQDQDWREVVNDRHAHYSNLRARKHRFRVLAANNSGLWNETGDSLEFAVDAAFYQTGAFRALAAAVVLCLMWVAYRFRVRRIQREFNARLGERLDERARIARELHDTLLQSFQGLMFSFQAARNLLPSRTGEAIRTLDDAIREGDAAIAEGRSAIHGLRGNPLESNLELLLTSAGNELARSSAADGIAASFRVVVEGARQPLSALLQDDIHRIAREILRNAFHHARATRIEAEITYDTEFFRLRIRDNGKGIDPNVLRQGAREGHWGLPGVRERARRIGAEFKLWSESGAGAEAELKVPARVAYRTAPAPAGWRIFGKRKAAAPDGQ